MIYDVAIICSSIENRKPLIPRSLTTWASSIKASGLTGVICVSAEGYDGESVVANTLEDKGVAWCYHHLPEPFGTQLKEYNYWIRTIRAKVYILTGPEVLFPTTAVRTAFDACQPDRYVNFKMFYIPKHMTDSLDNFPWQQPEALEACEELYHQNPIAKDETYRVGPDAEERNWNIDTRAMEGWESNATSALDHDTLHRMMPFEEFTAWGFDDPFHALVRRHLGFETYTLQDPILFHQHHPRTKDGQWISWEDHSRKILAAFAAWKERNSL